MSASRQRTALGIALRLLVAGAALWWTFSRAPLAEIGDAFRRIAPGSVAIAIAIYGGLILVAALRWGWLLWAYGARHIPLSTRTNLILVGQFYNTFLPGAVLGDVTRSHLSRRAFDGAAGAYMVVLLDRVVGLLGLLLLCSVVQVFRPVAGVSELQLPALAVFVAGIGLASVPFFAHRLAPVLPDPVGKWLRDLPALQRPSMFVGALGLSVLGHAAIAVCAHVLLSAAVPGVALTDSIVIVPIAMASIYFPATVAGLGVREIAFITLYAPVGVDAPTAAAISFALLGLQALYAFVGGALSVIAPVSIDAGDD